MEGTAKHKGLLELKFRSPPRSEGKSAFESPWRAVESGRKLL